MLTWSSINTINIFPQLNQADLVNDNQWWYIFVICLIYYEVTYDVILFIER